MKPCPAFAVFFLVPALASAQEWTRFRGPNGSGVSSAESLPTMLGAEQNRAWRTEVPDSSSSPILGKDAVFLTAATAEELLVLCLDPATGAVRWRRSLERAHPSEMFASNDSASPTPVTDGENVYCFFPELGLVSFDGEGEERWRLPLGPFVSFYGMAASPILAGDTLVQLCDQQQGSFLVAVDASTGKVRWRKEREGMIESWTTPVLDATGERILVFGTFFVCAYSVKDGAELWRMEGVGYTPVCSPIVAGERLFVSVPYHAEQPLPSYEVLSGQHDADEDGKLTRAELGDSILAEHFGWADADKDGFITGEEWAFCLAGMGTRNFGLVAIDLAPDEDEGPVRELWRHKRALPSIATPLLLDGVLYLVKDGGIVTLLDAESGAEHARERLPDGGGEYYASPVAADGKVYVASNAGKLTVLKAGPEWEVLADNDLGEEILATPAIGDGALFVRTKGALSCFREQAER